MKHLFTTALLGIVVSINAQSISSWVISSAGGVSSSHNRNMSFTIGEMAMVKTFSSKGYHLTQGFQQSEESPVSIRNIPAAGIKQSLHLFPNPVIEDFQVEFEFEGAGNVQASIRNVLGEEVVNRIFETDYQGGKQTQKVSVSDLPSGLYFLFVTHNPSNNGKAISTSTKFQVIN